MGYYDHEPGSHLTDHFERSLVSKQHRLLAPSPSFSPFWKLPNPPIKAGIFGLRQGE